MRVPISAKRLLLNPSRRNSKFGKYEYIQEGKYELRAPSYNLLTCTSSSPDYSNLDNPPPSNPIKSPDEIDKMRKSCKIAAKVLAFAESLVKPGLTTRELDGLVFAEIARRGAFPSPLGYRGFPNSVCTSVNNVLAHGIPDDRPLKNGDIVNVDVTVYYDGFHGDTSDTFLVGDAVDEKGIRLVEDTRTALALGIAACKPGAHFKDIGGVIHEFALSRGYSVNTDFCGHGIGSQFHEAPLIHHFANSFHGVMEENMTFTIEPMLCQGRASPSVKWDDGWTAVTPDGSRTAQAEHTVLIVSGGHDENNDHNGVEILTRRTKRIE